MHSKYTITTQCCEASNVHKAVFLDFSWEEAEDVESLTDIKPKWFVKGFSDDLSSMHGSFIEAKFCPFCAKPVPEIEINKEAEKHDIFEMTDGYCRTCGERNRACVCLPGQFRWKPVGKEVELPIRNKEDYED